MIERLRRQTWNWLPAFLAVADAGSIAAASRRLGLTPAAISRTIRLLEDEIGEPLFNRVGRTLALNQTGSKLSEAVRDAVRAVDGGLSDALADPFAGPLRVASIGVLTESFVIPALTELRREHDQLLPEHLNLGTAEANAALIRGAIDVAFYYEELTAESVLVERLGQTTASVYCGAGHPLFDRRRVTRDQVLSHPFSVPQIGDSGRVMDGWPSDVARTVGMRITMLQSNLQIGLSGTLLTVLPDITAAPHLAAGQLRKLPAPEIAPIEVFAARNRATAERGGVRELIDRVARSLDDARRTIKRAARRR